MGGHLRQEDDRLRVQRDQQHRAEGAFPILHQGAGACRLLQRDYRLPHGGGRGRGPSAQERDTAPYPAHARPRVLYQAVDAVRQDGRRHAARQRTAVGNGGKGEDAHRHRLRTENGTRYAHDRPALRRPSRQQGFALRQDACGVLPQIRRAQGHAVRVLGPGDVPAGRGMECLF